MKYYILDKRDDEYVHKNRGTLGTPGNRWTTNIINAITFNNKVDATEYYHTVLFTSKYYRVVSETELIARLL